MTDETVKDDFAFIVLRLQESSDPDGAHEAFIRLLREHREQIRSLEGALTQAMRMASRLDSKLAASCRCEQQIDPPEPDPEFLRQFVSSQNASRPYPDWCSPCCGHPKTAGLGHTSECDAAATPWQRLHPAEPRPKICPGPHPHPQPETAHD